VNTLAGVGKFVLKKAVGAFENIFIPKTETSGLKEFLCDLRASVWDHKKNSDHI